MAEQQVVQHLAGIPHKAEYHVSNGRVYVKSQFGEVSGSIGIFRADFVAGTLLKNLLLKARKKNLI